jgi:hypothetical protein
VRQGAALDEQPDGQRQQPDGAAEAHCAQKGGGRRPERQPRADARIASQRKRVRGRKRHEQRRPRE